MSDAKDPLRYQSPIPLCTYGDQFDIDQCISKRGKNHGASYDEETNVFNVNDEILLTIDSRVYKLVEYHFHIESEHTINKKRYPAEIHYVFHDIKTCDENIFVIARLIKDTKCHKKHINLSKLQVNLPSSYFEYDGSLTGENDGTTPVRWIVGRKYIRLPLKEIEMVAKTPRKLQPLDDRIILYKC